MTALSSNCPDGQSRLLKCPICRRRLESLAFRPFCSRRCTDIDLGHWLGGTYRIEADEEASVPSADDVP